MTHATPEALFHRHRGHRGGVDDGGGAHGHVRGARGWLLLRQRRAAVTGALGGHVGEKQRRGERTGVSGWVQGRAWRPPGGRGTDRQGGGGRARAHARRPRALSSWRGGEDDWQVPVGWADTVPGQVSGPGESFYLSLSNSVSLFYLFSFVLN